VTPRQLQELTRTASGAQPTEAALHEPTCVPCKTSSHVTGVIQQSHHCDVPKFAVQHIAPLHDGARTSSSWTGKPDRHSQLSLSTAQSVVPH
jgi:hypothetical protein